MSALFNQICYGEIMKKLVLCAFLSLMWCNVGFAETWSCAYKYQDDTRQYIVKRKGNHFHNIYSDGRIGGIGKKIILENQKSIHLHSNIDEKTSFLVVLDKINKTFVMIGLRYENSTDIIQGKCTIFE